MSIGHRHALLFMGLLAFLLHLYAVVHVADKMHVGHVNVLNKLFRQAEQKYFMLSLAILI